ncbi:dickkopf-related protein 2-like [Polymixia lowei]
MRPTVLLALAAAWTCVEARVKLNSIRTVILRETHALPGNTNTTSREDLHMLYQCISDLECSEGSYCHAPSKSHTYSRCQTCRRRKRRCHRDGMCCPGNRCSNRQVGDPCLRSSDCSEGLCCARHFWARICKPVLLEGQVCTRHRRKAHHGLELFQRCDCGEGLTCRTLREPDSQSPSSSSSFSSQLIGC